MPLTRLKLTAIDDGAITSAKIANGAVATVDLEDGSVTALKIADGGVDTADLADDAVTTAKIEDDAVTTAKIVDGAITQAKIDSGVSLGSGYFLGENGATGDTTNGLGDIFRVHEDTLDTAVTIAANTNAVAAGPLTLNEPVTVNGTLTIV